VPLLSVLDIDQQKINSRLRNCCETPNACLIRAMHGGMGVTQIESEQELWSDISRRRIGGAGPWSLRNGSSFQTRGDDDLATPTRLTSGAG